MKMEARHFEFCFTLRDFMKDIKNQLDKELNK